MKSITYTLFILGALLFAHTSCSNKNEIPDESLSSVSSLEALATETVNEIYVKWKNPENKDVIKVELSYSQQTKAQSITPAPILVDLTPASDSEIKILVPQFAVYEITAVTIDKTGKRYPAKSVNAAPRKGDAPDTKSVFMERADSLMSSVKMLFFGKSTRDCWNASYPNATGPYWDGDATVWGQGGGLSGYTAIRAASLGMSKYEQKYTGLTDRMFNSINRFITTDNNIEAYAVYPANGNDRLYDDNAWIGLDMADLYEQTHDSRFLEKATLVWKYLMHGKDDTCGGGIHWKEMNGPTNTKHTCSTAPAAVLGCKLYLLTNEETYLDVAKELYKWLQTYLQDPDDYLYWDCIGPDMVPSKAKYSYNAGQPMQVACLLYKITGEQQYLTDAQDIAKSAYKKWFVPFHSYFLNETFNILDPGHVWFQAILLRGFIELYKTDGNHTYVSAYEKTFSHAWQSDCRNRDTNLMNEDFRGGTTQSKWDILHEGACVEMLARLAVLERDGK